MNNHRWHRRRRRRAGFTLMEVLLVLAILVILGSMAVVSYTTIFAGAKEDAARTQLGIFEDAMKLYSLHVGSYPSTDGGIMALKYAPSDLPDPNRWRGPYLEKDVPADPWGNEYRYELINAQQYRFWSFGTDRMDGTDDDIIVSNVSTQ